MGCPRPLSILLNFEFCRYELQSILDQCAVLEHGLTEVHTICAAINAEHQELVERFQRILGHTNPARADEGLRTLTDSIISAFQRLRCAESFPLGRRGLREAAEWFSEARRTGQMCSSCCAPLRHARVRWVISLARARCLRCWRNQFARVRGGPYLEQEPSGIRAPAVARDGGQGQG